MAQMTEHRINSEVKIGVLKWPIFFSFQCCLTWLLAYPVLAVLTFMVLPFHYRYKVSTTECISLERKYLLLSLLFFLLKSLNSVRVFSVKIQKDPKKHNSAQLANGELTSLFLLSSFQVITWGLLTAQSISILLLYRLFLSRSLYWEVSSLATSTLPLRMDRGYGTRTYNSDTRTVRIHKHIAVN